jgi:hypothetical protein
MEQRPQVALEGRRHDGECYKQYTRIFKIDTEITSYRQHTGVLKIDAEIVEYHATMESCSDSSMSTFQTSCEHVLIVLTVCAWRAVYCTYL